MVHRPHEEAPEPPSSPATAATTATATAQGKRWSLSYPPLLPSPACLPLFLSLDICIIAITDYIGVGGLGIQICRVSSPAATGATQGLVAPALAQSQGAMWGAQL